VEGEVFSLSRVSRQGESFSDVKIDGNQGSIRGKSATKSGCVGIYGDSPPPPMEHSLQGQEPNERVH
jgi:hypothetical protein